MAVRLRPLSDLTKAAQVMRANAGLNSWFYSCVVDGKEYISTKKYGRPCYADMDFVNVNSEYVNLYSLVKAGGNTKKEGEQLVEFLQFICGDDSPWAKYIGDIEIFAPEDKDHGKSCIIKVEDVMNKSSQALVNFLIATRIPYEYEGKFLTYLRLKEKKPDVPLSWHLFFASQFYESGGTLKKTGAPGHFPFDTWVDPVSLCNGDPTVRKETLRDGASYRACNVMWGILLNYDFLTGQKQDVERPKYFFSKARKVYEIHQYRYQNNDIRISIDKAYDGLAKYLKTAKKEQEEPVDAYLIEANNFDPPVLKGTTGGLVYA